MARIPCSISTKTVFLLSMLASTGLVLAQQAPSAAPPPPQQKLEPIEPGSDAPVTITPQKRDKNKISQTKDGGRVKEVQVSAGGSNYTMKGVQPGSTADLNSQNGSTVRPPQWKVLEFDFNKKKKIDPEGAGADTTVNAPPPQTVK
ncbi:hypothetical protein [Massilia sp. PWRC2]|uniref:hypothetical protein n=1 Tax=Massilia sp. PWRC2 TaxID=2804626 RepID=UPI003CE7335F